MADSAQLLLHRFTQRPPRPRQSRHYGANRYGQCERNFMVRHLFDLTEKKYLPISDRQAGDCFLNDLLACLAEQNGLGRLMFDWEGRAFLRQLERNRSGLKTRAGIQEYVAQYAKNPSLKIGSGLKRRKPL